MLSISFACVASKINKKGESPIQLWVNCNGKRATTYLDLRKYRPFIKGQHNGDLRVVFGSMLYYNLEQHHGHREDCDNLDKTAEGLFGK